MPEAKISPRIEKFIDALPDAASARLFIERLFEEHAHVAARCMRNEELCANILTLATYSPLLAETILQHPDYIAWLEREQDLAQVKSKESLLEELARFASVNSKLDESTRLTRFKRRELLRIYLRDCLKLATLSETTEEFSNLADAVLERALQSCYQPLLARYGRPQTVDERGRLLAAEFAIVALGKLGSRELNYSSDIDLVFLYSADGETSGGEVVTNKFFFTKLAEAIVKMVGAPLGEGAVFRVDLRLRPRGREGDLVVSLKEALRYYRQEAQNWERQALVRARASAGAARVVEEFLLAARDLIFRPEPLIEALQDVKLAKEKIDSETAKRGGGFNVKLGKGGIREIEFIAQALQICYGGRDAWLRAPQTLIGLQRLSDKNLITDSERMRLAQAYTFLRLVEHRLQMEHGLQTHSLPQSQEKMALLARRCGYQEPDSFERDLQHHCQQVNAIYQRVFDPSILEKPKASRLPPLATRATNLTLPIEIVSADRVNIDRLFQESLTALTALPTIETDQADIANAIISGLQSSINVARSLRRLRDFALSAASDSAIKEAGKLSAEQIREFTIISGASHYFSQILISNPRLIRLLGGPLESALTNINSSAMIDLFTEQLRGVDFDEAGMRLRRCWHEQIIKIGRFDLLQPTTIDNEQSLRALTQINRAQTALAEASLAAACQLAGESAAQRYERADAPLIYTILGLGRLGHCGLDYNSDLDIVFIYSEASGDVAKQATNQEFYARMAEIVIQILSTLTREGALYRVDLRLRPDGRNGLLATSYDKLQQYISERAAIWELMAYLKLRPVAGDATFGQQIYDRVLELIFARARACATTLADEVKEMRNRLQVEKAGVDDYKFGIGGMLDVYFATRYLQLRHSKPDPAERGTMALINYLGNIELLSPEQTKKLKAGYGFLRRLDHETRLQLERPKSTLPHNQAQLLDLARRLGFANAEDLLSAYRQHRDAIRTTYQQIVDSEN